MPLKVSVPPDNVARIRFTTTAGNPLSGIIRLGTKAAVSHVECVVDKISGGTIVSSQIDYGVQNRPIDYDTWSTLQIFVDIPMGEAQYIHWTNFLWKHIGRPFDHAATFGFGLPFVDAHEEGAMICSSFIVASLRSCGYFPNILALRYHQISPVVVLMMLQAQPKERATIHPVEYSRG